jgi:hypothetical protein
MIGGGVMANGGTDALAGRHGILYRRAVAELDSARQALASLQPEEPENSTLFEAIRSLIDEGLVDIVSSLGSEIRPPKARVKAAFKEVLGVEKVPEDPPAPTNWTGIRGLGELAGFEFDEEAKEWKAREESLAEEQAFTRFLELDSYVRTLRRQYKQLVDTPVDSLTVRFAEFGRRVGFVGDATRELDLALATSPGDPTERQFEDIDDEGTTLDDFITWTNDFVADSQTQLREGTAEGLDAIGRDARRLRKVADAALDSEDVEVVKRHLVRRALIKLRGILYAMEPTVPEEPEEDEPEVE